VPIIKVRGLASGRVRELYVDEQSMDENLLRWLRGQGVTIASSCDGEGVCRKCAIQEEKLTCLLTPRAALQLWPDGIIDVAYL